MPQSVLEVKATKVARLPQVVFIHGLALVFVEELDLSSLRLLINKAPHMKNCSIQM